MNCVACIAPRPLGERIHFLLGAYYVLGDVKWALQLYWSLFISYLYVLLNTSYDCWVRIFLKYPSILYIYIFIWILKKEKLKFSWPFFQFTPVVIQSSHSYSEKNRYIDNISVSVMNIIHMEVLEICLSCYDVFTTYRQLLNIWTILSVHELVLISLIHD